MKTTEGKESDSRDLLAPHFRRPRGLWRRQYATELPPAVDKVPRLILLTGEDDYMKPMPPTKVKPVPGSVGLRLVTERFKRFQKERPHGLGAASSESAIPKTATGSQFAAASNNEVASAPVHEASTAAARKSLLEISTGPIENGPAYKDFSRYGHDRKRRGSFADVDLVHRSKWLRKEDVGTRPDMPIDLT